jgi:hypothetical protein
MFQLERALPLWRFRQKGITNVVGNYSADYSGADIDRRLPRLAIQQRMGLRSEWAVIPGSADTACTFVNGKTLDS